MSDGFENGRLLVTRQIKDSYWDIKKGNLCNIMRLSLSCEGCLVFMRIFVLNRNVDISSDDRILAAMRSRARAPLVLIYRPIAISKGICAVLVTVLPQLDLVSKIPLASFRALVWY